MSRRSAVLVALCALLLALGLAFAATPSCSREVADDGRPAVDTEMMAFLSQARALHHEANLKEENGDSAGATAAIQRLVAAQRPHPDQTAPEIEEVLADAYARLAEMLLRSGDLDAAALAAKNGLDHASGPTYFRGHLVEVQGLIEEARAARFADAGDGAAAARARERAIALLEEVVKIQEQVIQRSLAQDGGSEASSR